MSDLAPMVAVVLKDHSLAELKKENQQLLDELSRRDAIDGAVRICGPNAPHSTYALGLIRKAKLWEDDHRIILKLTNSSGPKHDERFPTCPVQDIEKCVVHLGGKALATLGDFDNPETITMEGADHEAWFYVIGSKDEPREKQFQLTLVVSWGPVDPIGSPHSTCRPPSLCKNEDVQFVRFEELAITVPDPDVLKNDPGYRKLMEQLVSVNWGASA